MKAALLQISSGDDPAENLKILRAMLREAAENGAEFILTPEVSNCVSQDRAHQREVLCFEEDDPTLAGLRAEAADLGVWLVIGSLGIKTHDADGRFANRCFVIAPDGAIAARYDKIHMFDVDLTATETFRESAGYRPGGRAVVVETPFGKIGLSICYDVRFAHLYRRLAKAGAEILLVPAAFSPVTGEAHWEPLLRARAIENGCFVLAAAQTGDHPISKGKPRVTHGHSMVVGPWGNVMVDAGTETGIVYADIDLGEVARARGRVPSLTHDRPFEGP